MLTVLDARGIDVPDDARERITISKGNALPRMLRRAAIADSVYELFI